jgi:cell division protein DivIC
MNWSGVYQFFRNKYIISLIFFVVWVGFFDRNNLVSQYKLGRELRRMEKEKAFYLEQIEQDTKATEDLLNNPEIIEKYARERHLMKRENEDIFLIIRKPEPNDD